MRSALTSVESKLGPGKVKALLCLTLVALAVVYFCVRNVSVEVDQTRVAQVHKIEIHSLIHQQVELNIVSTGLPLTVTLNKDALAPRYPYPRTRVSHQDAEFGDIYLAKLNAGPNLLEVHSQRRAPVAVAQRLTFGDFVVALLFGLLPLTALVLIVKTALLERGLPLIKPALDSGWRGAMSRRPTWMPPGTALLWGILATGIVLRVVYALDMGYIQFQHDYYGHIEYIEFIAREGFVPLPHKAWEFPQQPLYYLANGALYNLLERAGIEKANILRVISFTTALLSCVGLIFAARLLPRLTSSLRAQAAALGFLCFCPSLLYMSTRINNDPWAMSLGIIALYYIVRAYQSAWQTGVLAAVISTSLLFMTKVSALLIEVFFAALLVISVWQQATINPALRRALWVFSLAGTACLSYTLYRAWVPAASALSMVNSGIWPGQDLRPLHLGYLFSFEWQALLHDAQANIAGTENHAITRSFPTYQYATMLFGEFDYGYWRSHAATLYTQMQGLVILGLLVPLAWLASLSQRGTLNRLFMLLCLGSVMLVLKFIVSFPSVSNSDFRYHAPVMMLFALLFGLGVHTLAQRFASLRGVIDVWLAALAVLSLCFSLTLIGI